MSESTKYKIEHVRDFLKVPETRQAECLQEFADFLDTARTVSELIAVAGEVVGSPNLGNEIGSFTWIDDGKRNRTIRIHVDQQEKGAGK